jgi:hypothetical protein
VVRDEADASLARVVRSLRGEMLANWSGLGHISFSPISDIAYMNKRRRLDRMIHSIGKPG